LLSNCCQNWTAGPASRGSRAAFLAGLCGPGVADKCEPAYRYRTCPNDRSPLSRSAAPISWPQPALASIMTIIWIYTPAS
jgi:hypothetical protein